MRIHHPITTHTDTHTELNSLNNSRYPEKTSKPTRGPRVLIIRDMQIKPQRDSTAATQIVETRRQLKQFCQACGESGILPRPSGSVHRHSRFGAPVTFANPRHAQVKLLVLQWVQERARTHGNLPSLISNSRMGKLITGDKTEHRRRPGGHTDREGPQRSLLLLGPGAGRVRAAGLSGERPAT